MRTTRAYEAKIKKEIKDYLRGIGAFCATVQGGIFSERGNPDLLVCYKGKFIGLEVKTPLGHPSKDQLIRGREIEKAGGVFAIVMSVDDVKEIIEK